MFVPPFKEGSSVANAAIMAAFHCACEGGIRPANATDTIVLVLNHTKHPDSRDWQGDVLLFRGSGSRGDQTLAKGLNRTLLTGLEKGRPVYLFEVFRQGEYTFRGRVELAREPFEKDEAGRKVWIFPLRLVAGDGEIQK